MIDAVLVIDMQNTFLDDAGASVRRGAPIMDAAGVVARCAGLIASARRAGWDVIYTRHRYRTDLRDMSPALRALYPPGITPATLGSWDADIVPALTPEPTDPVIDKNRFDAFLYTDADLLVRQLGIEHVVVCGVVSHLCVETSVRSAHQRDLRVTVAADAVGGTGPVRHRAALASMADFARVVPTGGIAELA
jgi:nicotinamidase-related amidase